MKLTIGMIVKNEEKWLDKCLYAIKPILENVDSELIITDTGSDDRTVEIAEKYTDKVLHFDWINNFAAARNTALDKAKGEWFMFLDADEIFESCEGIISFFNSGEYRNYSSATYIVRNLTNDSDSYSDFMASRMTRRYSDTRFEGIIHEHLTHFTYPIKTIGDVALHYGYVFENKEQSVAKAKRNIELLEKKLASDPDELTYIHLYDSCRMSGDIDRANEYLDRGIEHCKNVRSPYVAVCYNAKALAALRAGDHDKASEICGDYFDCKKSLGMGELTSDIEIYGLRASILYDHLNFGGAKSDYQHFFDLYEDVKSGKLNTDDASALNFRIATDKDYIGNLCAFIDCCAICGDTETAIKYLSRLPVYKYGGFKEKERNGLVDKILSVLKKTGGRGANECWSMLDGNSKELLVGKLIGMTFNSADKAEAIEALKHIGKSDPQIRSMAELYESFFTENTLTAEQVNEYIREYGADSDPFLLKLAMDKHLDISEFFKDKNFDMKKTAYLCCRNLIGFYDTLESYPADTIGDTDIIPDLVKFYEQCMSLRLIDNDSVPKEEKSRLIEKMFRVKTALNDIYTRQNAGTEFQRLAKTVKDNIMMLIRSGNTAMALKALEDYGKLAPDDPEIKILEKEVNAENE